MGTTTIYLKHNDIGMPLNRMKRDDLKELSRISPYGKEQHYKGWSTPLELHNGNVYRLVFWKGRLLKLEDTPKTLNRKYYDKYRGRALNVYEWTLLKRLASGELDRLDKEFRKELKKEKGAKK